MDETFGYAPTPKKARIEIIPLIDVIFFLLATFVLFTLSLDKIRAIDVTLPVVPPLPDATILDRTVYIQASEAGTFHWKEGAKSPTEIVTAAALPARLDEYKNRVQPSRVFVRGDGNARLGAAVFILDEVRKAGIEQVSVETIPSVTGN
jgi:biopolymer transport protein ExbD